MVIISEPHPAAYLVWIDGEGSEVYPTLADAEEAILKVQEEKRLQASSDGEWSSDTAIRLYRLVSESDTEAVAGGGGGDEGRAA